MENPHDLVAFLNQDIRWSNIVNLYQDLSQRQTEINKMWSKIERETKVMIEMTEDDSCVKGAHLNSLNWYNYQECLEDHLKRKIPSEDLLLYHPSKGQDSDVPDCKKISSLTFSMSAFEHLEVPTYSYIC